MPLRALVVLGFGYEESVREALSECAAIIESHTVRGKVILQGTSTKTYLPKEKVGGPSKWNTFCYMQLFAGAVIIVTEVDND